MSLKSIIQIFVILLIILIIGGVYLHYFKSENILVEEVMLSENENTKQIEELQRKLTILELKNKELDEMIENKTNITEKDNSIHSAQKNVNSNNQNKQLGQENEISNKLKNLDHEVKENIEKDTKIVDRNIKNLVKDVEYTSIDKKGNKFFLLATSGKSNKKNKDILDLDNVRGEITSDVRDTIYITSDQAQYNSVNLNSKFYKNVIINYQDKEITCINFDINMESNKAIAYNNVIITDPNSTMKAGIVEFDLKTKDININPESDLTQIEVISN